VKNVLFSIAGILAVTACVGVSYFVIGWHSQQSVDVVIPVPQANFSLPLRSGGNIEEYNIDVITRIFNNGEHSAVLTVPFDEITDFTRVSNIDRQIAEVLPAFDYTNTRPATMLSISTNNEPTIYVWHFVFTNENDTLSVYYHAESDYILELIFNDEKII